MSPTLEASGIFSVGMGMACILVPLSTLEVRSRALPCCTLTGKAIKKLVLCIPVLL